MAKHYDNKADIIRRIKENRIRADIAEASAFSANMLMSLYVLRDTFRFGQVRADRFIDGMKKLNQEISEDKISIQDIEKRIFDDLGIVVEMPKIGGLK